MKPKPRYNSKKRGLMNTLLGRPFNSSGIKRKKNKTIIPEGRKIGITTSKYNPTPSKVPQVQAFPAGKPGGYSRNIVQNGKVIRVDFYDANDKKIKSIKP